MKLYIQFFKSNAMTSPKIIKAFEQYTDFSVLINLIFVYALHRLQEKADLLQDLNALFSWC